MQPVFASPPANSQQRLIVGSLPNHADVRRYAAWRSPFTDPESVLQIAEEFYRGSHLGLTDRMCWMLGCNGDAVPYTWRSRQNHIVEHGTGIQFFRGGT